ncbi:MAG: hypothetical protein JSR98_20165 [Proteobacteria bacterium]|nr:hypothetical protein [Pseudomonadota bacterium]
MPGGVSHITAEDREDAAAWAAERDRRHVARVLKAGGFPAWSEYRAAGPGLTRLGLPLIRPDAAGAAIEGRVAP